MRFIVIGLFFTGHSALLALRGRRPPELPVPFLPLRWHIITQNVCAGT